MPNVPNYRTPILFRPVTITDTSDDVPIVGTVDGFKRDKKAGGLVVYVFVPDNGKPNNTEEN